MLVDVRNFQSIEHASIRIDGFTALVGKSNIGKSALVRAIKSALTGASGTSFVRHKNVCARTLKKSKTCECFTSVHLQSDQFNLLWEKGDKVNRYTYNGQVYDRAEQGTPEFLLRPSLPMDFDTVDVARKGQLLQVADQFDNLFLLNQTGSTVADVLSDVAQLDCVNAAMRLVEKDRREASSTRKVYEKDLLDLSVRAASFDGLDTEVAKATRVEAKLDLAIKTQKKVAHLTQYHSLLNQVEFKIDSLESVSALSIPTTNKLLHTHKKVDTLVHFWDQVKDRGMTIKALSGVENVVIPKQAPGQEAFEKLNVWVARLTELQATFGKFKTVEVLQTPISTEMTTKREHLTLLDGLLKKVAHTTISVQELTIDCQGLEQELEELKTEARELGYCPTCTQKVETHLHA